MAGKDVTAERSADENFLKFILTLTCIKDARRPLELECSYQ